VRRVRQHHRSAYWYSKLKLGLAAVGNEPTIERGEMFALTSNPPAVVTVVGDADPERPGSPRSPLEGSAGSGSREGLD
jgi:hypothetical protein